MGIRRQARESALQLLFAQDRAPLTEAALAAFWEASEAPERARPYALELAQLVRRHQAELDQVIARYAENWTVDRMSRVDRNLLRLAVCEMFYVDDVPVRVSLDEAVEVAKAFGGEESGRFVNGILDRVAREEAGRVTGGESLSTKVS